MLVYSFTLVSCVLRPLKYKYNAIVNITTRKNIEAKNSFPLITTTRPPPLKEKDMKYFSLPVKNTRPHKSFYVFLPIHELNSLNTAHQSNQGKQNQRSSLHCSAPYSSSFCFVFLLLSRITKTIMSSVIISKIRPMDSTGVNTI